MLQFQKDNQKLPCEQGDSLPVENNSQILPKSPNPAQSDDNQEFLTVSDKKGQLRKSTYLLAVLFLVGIVSLFAMIKESTPAQAAAAQSNTKQAEQSQIEAAISKITGIRTQMFSSLEKIVTKFYEFSNVEQVDVDELSKNPFMEDNYLGSIKPDDAQGRLALIRGELELLSIMSTDKGYCCMINDKLLYEGDTIKGLKVAEITSNSVSLGNGSMSITLKLSSEF
ncbi:MAG: hypothetical protein JW837_03030 [Sedimentisphaerales bacterium]|nr:hypothetical protein [Sedimentisphaerales bacterium]